MVLNVCKTPEDLVLVSITATITFTQEGVGIGGVLGIHNILY